MLFCFRNNQISNGDIDTHRFVSDLARCRAEEVLQEMLEAVGVKLHCCCGTDFPTPELRLGERGSSCGLYTGW